MKRSRFTLSVAIFLACLAPFRAQAAGVITGLAASANPVAVNTDVTFTVKGTSGGCGEVILDYGDGQTYTLASVSFQNNTNTTSPPHRYGIARTYVVKANPGKGCTGSAVLSLVVTGSGGSGGGVTAIPRAARTEVRGPIAEMFSDPLIETVFPLSVISPGGGVIVQGLSFGKEPGKLLLRLHHEASLTSLGGLTWSSRTVSGTIDPNITGVPDQPAYLHVIRADGKRSNEVPVTFTARHEVQLLPSSDVQVTCSRNADMSNECFPPDGWPFDGTFFAYHSSYTCVFDLCGDLEHGADVVRVHLLNGWVYHSHGRRNTKGKVHPTVCPREGADFACTTNWETEDGSNFSAYYTLDIFVEGPVGMSWK